MNKIISTIEDRLCELSEKWIMTTVFDSDVHGKGIETLERTVLNKRNLYFIHIDDSGDVFCGYLDNRITQVNKWISDSNSFVCSIVRNNQLNIQRYNIKDSDASNAFYLCCDEEHLYGFGNDIIVSGIGEFSNYYSQITFKYGKKESALVGFKEDERFKINRLIVVEMGNPRE